MFTADSFDGLKGRGLLVSCVGHIEIGRSQVASSRRHCQCTLRAAFQESFGGAETLVRLRQM